MGSRHALIVGGGIGGLTLALALAERGHRVSLFEQAPAWEGAGAGIGLSPNATRVLCRLGLEDALRQVACVPGAAQFRHWRTGRVIAESPLGEAAAQRYGAPYFHVHRDDLVRVLVEAASAQRGASLHLGCRVEAVAGASMKVDGERQQRDVLVGADGIHSAVRQALWGRDAPRFTDNVAWRALVPAERLPEGMVAPNATVWWGPRRHFVHYLVRGEALVNCVCVVERSGWELESWTERGSHAELRADFAGWHPAVQELIRHMDHERLFKWALHDRAPLRRWGKGDATLLGDACHPMLPFLAQGGAMAIEDAEVLADCLTDGEVEPALRRYERLRQPRTAAVQRQSRRNATVFHLSGIMAWLRDQVAPAAQRRIMDRVYRHDAGIASAQSSIQEKRRRGRQGAPRPPRKGGSV